MLAETDSFVIPKALLLMVHLEVKLFVNCKNLVKTFKKEAIEVSLRNFKELKLVEEPYKVKLVAKASHMVMVEQEPQEAHHKGMMAEELYKVT